MMTERYFAEQIQAQARMLLPAVPPGKRNQFIRAAADVLLGLVDDDDDFNADLEDEEEDDEE